MASGETRAPEDDVPVCIGRILDLHLEQPTRVEIKPDANDDHYHIVWETVEN